MNSGAAAEAMFDYLATAKGLMVSRPLSDCSYDRIVDSGGKLSRVQIKMCSIKLKQQYANNDRFTVQTSSRNGSMYTGKIEYFAIYIQPVDQWFIIPVKDVVGPRLTLTLGGNGKKYLNKWDELF